MGRVKQEKINRMIQNSIFLLAGLLEQEWKELIALLLTKIILLFATGNVIESQVLIPIVTTLFWIFWTLRMQLSLIKFIKFIPIARHFSIIACFSFTYLYHLHSQPSQNLFPSRDFYLMDIANWRISFSNLWYIHQKLNFQFIT